MGKSRLKQRRRSTGMVEAVENRLLLTAVVVNSLPDVLHSGGSVISLRDAIAVANASTSPTTITFSPTVFAAATTLSVTGGFLELTNTHAATTITGPAAPLTISFNNNVTLNQAGGFIEDGGVTMTLSAMTITKSTETGIAANGTLTLNNVIITDNASGGSAAAGITFGPTSVITGTNVIISNNTANNGGTAGIDGDGKLTLTDCTISGNNTADDQFGAVYIYDDGLASLRNVTVYNNNEGGIDFSSTVSTSLYNVTVADNGGFGVYSGGATAVTVANTIIAGNTQPDVQGAFISKGHNLIGNTAGGGETSTGWISTDLQGTTAKPISAKLGSLASNGGFSQTLLPLSGSPAIDGGLNSLVPSGITTDQRGLPRIQGAAVDIGAVEVQPPPVITLTAPANQTAKLGVSGSVTLGSFTQSAATAPFKVDIAWGDGSADTILSLSAAGTIPATAHSFAKSGAITVSETVTDSGTGKSNKATFLETVASGAAIKVTPPAAQTATLNVSTPTVLGAFTQSGATGPFKVDVKWGDGTTDSTITVTTAGTIPTTAHTFKKTGNLDITETVTDSKGNSSTPVTFVDTVTAPASLTVTPPVNQTAAPGKAVSVSLGSFTQTSGTAPYKVDVNWGDGTTDTVLTMPAAGTIPATSHTFAKTGAITITETVTDASGHKSPAATFTETVTDPKTASISGTVFNDVNSDRKLDNGEIGLGLWTVYIDANNNGKLDTSEKSVTTNISGGFIFTGLAAGTYVVRVVPVSGINSTLATSNVMTITLGVAQASAGNLFGEKNSA